MEYISRYILRKEFECSHCGNLPAELNPPLIDEPYSSLFMTFSEIRREWGKPINIISGYRCPEHNADPEVGGVPLSVHLFGLALDLRCKPSEVNDLYVLIEQICPSLRIGLYNTFIHIDFGWKIHPRVLREWHPRARWDKRRKAA